MKLNPKERKQDCFWKKSALLSLRTTSHCLTLAYEQEKIVVDKRLPELRTVVLDAQKCLEDCKNIRGLVDEWWEQPAATVIYWVQLQRDIRSGVDRWESALRESSILLSYKVQQRDGDEDMLLIHLAEKNKWRKCPGCQYYVEKIDGCLHITCRCGYELCHEVVCERVYWMSSLLVEES